MLQEGLQYDHIAVSTTIYYVTQPRVDNQKFIYEPMRTICGVTRGKNIQPTVNNRSSVKRIIFVLKTVHSKIIDSLLNRATVSF